MIIQKASLSTQKSASTPNSMDVGSAVGAIVAAVSFMMEVDIVVGEIVALPNTASFKLGSMVMILA